MRKIKKLGVFDSGLGGYTIYYDLKKAMKDLPLVLFADQKNAPYGNYDNAHIIKLAHEAMQWFYDRGINDVLLACNTVTSIGLDAITESFPNMRIWGIVDITVNQLPKGLNSVGVVATQATINSNSYSKAIEANYGYQIVARPLRDLAKAIEDLQPADVIEAMIQPALKDMAHCSHILLGCTHYPLALEQFKKHSQAIFMDSSTPIIEFVKANYEPSEERSHQIFTTGDPTRMEEQIERLFGEVEKVEGAYENSCL